MCISSLMFPVKTTSSCIGGQYWEEAVADCVVCDSSCVTCTGPSAFDCTNSCAHGAKDGRGVCPPKGYTPSLSSNATTVAAQLPTSSTGTTTSSTGTSSTGTTTTGGTSGSAEESTSTTTVSVTTTVGVTTTAAPTVIKQSMGITMAVPAGSTSASLNANEHLVSALKTGVLGLYGPGSGIVVADIQNFDIVLSGGSGTNATSSRRLDGPAEVVVDVSTTTETVNGIPTIYTTEIRTITADQRRERRERQVRRLADADLELNYDLRAKDDTAVQAAQTASAKAPAALGVLLVTAVNAAIALNPGISASDFELKTVKSMSVVSIVTPAAVGGAGGVTGPATNAGEGTSGCGRRGVGNLVLGMLVGIFVFRLV